jgi:hypothetical protein
LVVVLTLSATPTLSELEPDPEQPVKASAAMVAMEPAAKSRGVREVLRFNIEFSLGRGDVASPDNDVIS